MAFFTFITALLMLCLSISQGRAMDLSDSTHDYEITLKADNGRYWSVIGRGSCGGIRNIEASKLKEDFYTKFYVHVVGDEEHIYLKSNDGKYLSRIYRNGVNHIEATKTTPDVYCMFKVHQVGAHEVYFQADNGLYLSRIYRNGQNNIEAAKSTMDPYTKFIQRLE